MRRKINTFNDALMHLWAQVGLRPVTYDAHGPVQLSIDSINFLLFNRSDEYILIEAFVQAVANEKNQRIQQFKTALKINFCLVLDCKASLHLIHDNNLSYLAAHSIYPLTVNNTHCLIETINDSVRLVEFFRQASNSVYLSRSNQYSDRDKTPVVIVKP